MSSEISLVVRDGPMAGSRFDRSAASLILGRNEPTTGAFIDIDLAGAEAPGSTFISRTHAALDRTQEGCSLRDLGSRNGTFVNGQRLTVADSRGIVLRPGDLIRLGRVELTFLGPAPSQATPAVLVAAPSSPEPHAGISDLAHAVGAAGTPESRHGRIGATALIAGAATALAVFLIPTLREKAFSLADMLRGRWTEQACATFPVRCRDAFTEGLRAQMSDLAALAGRLDQAAHQLAPVLKQTKMERDRLTAEIAELGVAVSARHFPVVVAGLRYDAAAVAQARQMELRDRISRTEAQARALEDTSGKLASRQEAIAQLLADGRRRLALLPITETLSQVDQSLPALLQANRGAALLKRSGVEQRDEAEALLRSTDQLLGRR